MSCRRIWILTVAIDRLPCLLYNELLPGEGNNILLLQKCCTDSGQNPSTHLCLLWFISHFWETFVVSLLSKEKANIKDVAIRPPADYWLASYRYRLPVIIDLLKFPYSWSFDLLSNELDLRYHIIPYLVRSCWVSVKELKKDKQLQKHTHFMVLWLVCANTGSIPTVMSLITTESI